MELRIELSSALSNLSTKVAEVAGMKAALEEARGDNALMVFVQLPPLFHASLLRVHLLPHAVCPTPLCASPPLPTPPPNLHARL